MNRSVMPKIASGFFYFLSAVYWFAAASAGKWWLSAIPRDITALETLGNQPVEQQAKLMSQFPEIFTLPGPLRYHFGLISFVIQSLLIGMTWFYFGRLSASAFDGKFATEKGLSQVSTASALLLAIYLLSWPCHFLIDAGEMASLSHGGAMNLIFPTLNGGNALLLCAVSYFVRWTLKEKLKLQAEAELTV